MKATDDQKNDLLYMLEHYETTFEFTKKDGSKRLIVCTRNGEFTPAVATPAPRHEILEATSCPVFDLLLSEWRSFSWDAVDYDTIRRQSLLF